MSPALKARSQVYKNNCKTIEDLKIDMRSKWSMDLNQAVYLNILVLIGVRDPGFVFCFKNAESSSFWYLSGSGIL